MKVKVFNSQTQVEVTELDLTEVFAAHEDVCLIGRSATSGLVLESTDISRLHGKFFRQDGEIFYTDLGSRNGSKVNNQLAAVNQNYHLKSGDLIQAGEFVLIMQDTEDFPEDATVVSSFDATVISPLQFIGKSPEVVDAEMVDDDKPGAIVRAEAVGAELEDPGHQTKALFDAINKRVISELQAAGNLTRDAYLNAIRKARESVEHSKFINPKEIEKEAEKYWQAVAKGTTSFGGRIGSAAAKSATQLGSRLGTAAAKGASNLGSRLGAATKAALGAAWKEITAPKSHPEPPSQPPSPPSGAKAPEADQPQPPEEQKSQD